MNYFEAHFSSKRKKLGILLYHDVSLNLSVLCYGPVSRILFSSWSSQICAYGKEDYIEICTSQTNKFLCFPSPLHVEPSIKRGSKARISLRGLISSCPSWLRMNYKHLQTYTYRLRCHVDTTSLIMEEKGKMIEGQGPIVRF